MTLDEIEIGNVIAAEGMGENTLIYVTAIDKDEEYAMGPCVTFDSDTGQVTGFVKSNYAVDYESMELQLADFIDRSKRSAIDMIFEEWS